MFLLAVVAAIVFQLDLASHLKRGSRFPGFGGSELVWFRFQVLVQSWLRGERGRHSWSGKGYLC